MDTNSETNLTPNKERILNQVLDHPFFSGMNPEQRAMIAASVEPGAGREAVFNTDEIIFREGEPANRFYLIESGSILWKRTNPPTGPFQSRNWRLAM